MFHTPLGSNKLIPHRTFVAYIEKSFRDRGLRCDTLKLPRVSLAAVVKRQVLEGVQAVVKILRQSQVTGKIPLQVFDRRGGVDNVRFEGNFVPNLCKQLLLMFAQNMMS